MTTKRAPRLDLNPSAANRWTTCTASPQFILENWDKVPPSDTFFNQEGTTAHEVASAFLQNREPRIDDKYHCPVPVDKEMRWHGWNYAEYVRSLAGIKAHILTEQKLPLWYMPERNAIVDAIVINRGALHIIDYKYGEGIIVSPENNLQGVIYAMTVAAYLEADGLSKLPYSFPVYIHIYQPRSRNSDESPSHVWETTLGEIDRIAKIVSFTASAIKLQSGHFNSSGLVFAPSDKVCQWCPARKFCPERQKELTQDIDVLATIDDGPKHFPPVKAISVAQLCAILKHGKQIKKWIDDAEDYALEHLKAGHSLPGYKLVLSRGGNRYWSDPEKAAKLLLGTTILKHEEVIEEKVISPAEAEKKLGKASFVADLANLVAKSPGSPCIAPQDDKREAIGINATTEFEKITE